MSIASVPTPTPLSIKSRSAVSGKTRSQGLLDTNIVIFLSRLDPKHLPDDMVISSVTLAELSAGPHHADHPFERAKRMSILQHAEATFDPLPFDAEAARSYGLVVAAVLASGRKPRGRLADLMLAAIARANRLPLYTTNPTDFAGLDDLISIVPVPRPSST
jgi:predicted nucleic acid-binding protein